MAEFIPMQFDRAKEFLKNNHHGVLATRRKNGDLQMSPVTCGLDAQGRAVISSRETAYKVNNLRRDPRAALGRARRTMADGKPYLIDVEVARHGPGWAEDPWVPTLRRS